jgi:tagatose 6-phosphate kinase
MILCIGTTPTVQRTMVFDHLAQGEVNRAAEVHEYASGKSINVARVLHALGEAALAIGFAGGARGEFLLQELTRETIPHDFEPIARETRLCTTLIDRETAAVTELVEESPPATSAEWRKLNHLIDATLQDGDSDVIVFSGTLAPGAPADFISGRIGHGPRVIVDAKGEPLRLAMEKGDCVIKVNRQELTETLKTELGDDRALIEAARAATPRSGWLIVTLGAQGLLGSDGKALWRVRGQKVQAQNPIGSGDAVAAGIAQGIVRGWSFEDTLRRGAACGTANALTMLAGQVHPHDVERLQSQITVERVG